MDAGAELKKAASDSVRATDAIADYLFHVYPAVPREHWEQHARTIVVRLAGLDPPLLLATPDEIKE